MLKCRCSAGHYYCSDCPFSAYPAVGIYDCRAFPTGCTMETWEFTFTCNCVAPELRGVCCSDGNAGVDACPYMIADGDPCCIGGPFGGGGSKICPRDRNQPPDMGGQCTCGSDHRWRC